MFFCVSIFGQDFTRFVDSADANIDYSSKKALKFLDSVPSPLEKSIKGRIADYYALKSIIYDEFEDYPTSYQYNILAFEYAEKELNYETAGASALELFRNIYFTKKDTIAFKYLEKARQYYSLADYMYGELEVWQTEAYVKYVNGDYRTCCSMLIDKLNDYKGAKEDGYYHMFALYLITSSYIHLADFKNAHLYVNSFQELLNNPTVVPYNYYSFKSSLDLCFVEAYFKKNKLDSVQKYLHKSGALTNYMGKDTKRDFYELSSEYYLSIDDLPKSKTFLDSLKMFEDKMFNNVIESGFDINHRLLHAKEKLEVTSNENHAKTIWVTLLVGVLIILFVLGIFYFKRQKRKILDYNNQKTSLKYLKSNHEKLQVKVKGLEDYIGEVKREVKAISVVDEVNEQRSKIKELYKNVRLDSSTVLSKKENHLELINDLNVAFFSKLSERFPQLSDSEIIICYYLYTEFKSKEIAVFLGTSTRAIESKRYRIRKKLNIQKREMGMFEFLSEALKGDI
ncbi:hypothetical protein [uncultured Algibacter sp.]|uniref:helix-turn-helix transcriptional regulator n=1 Tax=uncultured Algibacter sp. TaxID=298659 RepID=UPI0026377AF0|nr:hypothetical protein [uncultured Algibacter sp.]